MSSAGLFVVMSHNLNNFCNEYEEVLTQCVLYYPNEYAFKVAEVPMVAIRMRWAFHDGSFHHIGRAIKATCKRVGIKHTRKAMLEYFRS